MNPYALLGGLVATIVVAGGSFWFGISFQKGQSAREEVLIQRAGDAAAERAATAIAGIKTKVYPIREKIETTIRELPPMPVECNAPKSIVDGINEARKAP